MSDIPNLNNMNSNNNMPDLNSMNSNNNNISNMNNGSNDLMQDLYKLLDDEGKLVKELSDVATKAAGFHARLECIEKALESNPNDYDSKEADQFVKKAQEKYSNEIQGKLNDNSLK